MSRRILIPVLSSLSLAANFGVIATGSEATYDLWFWLREGVQNPELDPRFIWAPMETPCNQTVQARVSRMPAFDDPVFVPDVAVELSTDGQVIRRWPIVANSVVHDIAGNEILMNHVDALHWIGVDGTIRTEATVTPDAAIETTDCPNEITQTEHGYCRQYRDKQDGRPRLVAAPDVCT